MKLTIAATIMFLGQISLAETIICEGAFWKYRVKIESSCEYKMKPKPGLKPPPQESTQTLTPAECWKSVSLVQMDGAKCCIMGSDMYGIDCSQKGLKF